MSVILLNCDLIFFLFIPLWLETENNTDTCLSYKFFFVCSPSLNWSIKYNFFSIQRYSWNTTNLNRFDAYTYRAVFKKKTFTIRRRIRFTIYLICDFGFLRIFFPNAIAVLFIFFHFIGFIIWLLVDHIQVESIIHFTFIISLSISLVSHANNCFYFINLFFFINLRYSLCVCMCMSSVFCSTGHRCLYFFHFVFGFNSKVISIDSHFDCHFASGWLCLFSFAAFTWSVVRLLHSFLLFLFMVYLLLLFFFRMNISYNRFYIFCSIGFHSFRFTFFSFICLAVWNDVSEKCMHELYIQWICVHIS